MYLEKQLDESKQDAMRVGMIRFDNLLYVAALVRRFWYLKTVQRSCGIGGEFWSRRASDGDDRAVKNLKDEQHYE